MPSGASPGRGDAGGAQRTQRGARGSVPGRSARALSIVDDLERGLEALSQQALAGDSLEAIVAADAAGRVGGLERSTWRAAALFELFLVPRIALLETLAGPVKRAGSSGRSIKPQGERWSALGTPSPAHGARIPAPTYFLLAPFAWSGSPWLTSLGVALDSLGHLLALMGLATLLIGRPHRRVALTVAALILALSPWALLYADRPWNSNLVSLPIGLALLGFARWLEAPQRWRAFALLTIGLATLPSFHMSAPIIGLPMLMMVAWRWRTSRPASVITGAALSVIIWSPYALHELKHSGANTRGC